MSAENRHAEGRHAPAGADFTRFALVTAAALLILAAPAVAQKSSAAGTRPLAAVLGVVSEDGDDDVANELTSAVRTAVAQLETVTLDSREITLPQMLLANGCNDPDAECMGKVATTLGVQKVFFGSVRRADAGGSVFLVKFNVYNAASKTVERTVEDRLPATVREELGERAVRYVADLENIKLIGTVHVRVNVPRAAIQVDGRKVGEADSEGNFEVELEPGNHDLVVTSEGHDEYRQSVSVIANHGATVEVFLQPEGAAPALGTPARASDSSSLSWLGWSLVGLGVVGAGVTVVSSIMISGLDDDQPFTDYRRKVAKGKDACTEADHNEANGFSEGQVGKVKDTCSQASLFQALWWVGLGVGVAATAAGVYILLTDDDDGDDTSSDSASLRITPVVGRESGMLEANFQF